MSYEANLIKIYENDLTELTKEKKSIMKRLAVIERELLQTRSYCRQIKQRGEV
ncbi:hypothetical protein KTC96_24995 (plasmid) [Clostridium estertheticum]|uniref:hypothetical protein n=1 Tax=Clostridium estertheticum TaxID=238834 RepID=UPI001C7D6AB1|nr:hypothetical protein [Clostridium estertheticum]MBX4259787.1 hypothetical protein [Clostridium estertheticum]WLC73279.1 hypothetical protein KTC96_24995 [Clostridium estertheticum]